MAERIVDLRVKLPTRNSRDEPQPEVPQEYLHYDEVYEGFLENLDVTLEDWIAEAETHGVGTSVMQAEYRVDRSSSSKTIASRSWIGAPTTRWASPVLDPRNTMDAVREVERAILDLGLHGIVFEPGFLESRRSTHVVTRSTQAARSSACRSGCTRGSTSPRTVRSL